MFKILDLILRWSEFWALLIPLTIVIIYRVKKKETLPLIIYVFIALVLNFFVVLISTVPGLPHYLKRNSFCYNITAIIKVLLFGWALIQLPLLKDKLLPKILVALYLLWYSFHFGFQVSLLSFSSLAVSLAQLTIIAICSYFLLVMAKDESEIIWTEQPSFLICVSIAFNEAINLFNFLYFDIIANTDKLFSEILMRIFSVIFIVFCVFLAIILYRNRNRHRTPEINTLIN